jgi:hypothetical protein
LAAHQRSLWLWGICSSIVTAAVGAAVNIATDTTGHIVAWIAVPALAILGGVVGVLFTSPGIVRGSRAWWTAGLAAAFAMIVVAVVVTVPTGSPDSPKPPDVYASSPTSAKEFAGFRGTGTNPCAGFRLCLYLGAQYRLDRYDVPTSSDWTCYNIDGVKSGIRSVENGSPYTHKLYAGRDCTGAEIDLNVTDKIPSIPFGAAFSYRKR